MLQKLQNNINLKKYEFTYYDIINIEYMNNTYKIKAQLIISFPLNYDDIKLLFFVMSFIYENKKSIISNILIWKMNTVNIY